MMCPLLHTSFQNIQYSIVPMPAKILPVTITIERSSTATNTNSNSIEDFPKKVKFWKRRKKSCSQLSNSERAGGEKGEAVETAEQYFHRVDLAQEPPRIILRNGFQNTISKWLRICLCCRWNAFVVSLDNVIYFHDISNHILASGFQCRIL